MNRNHSHIRDHYRQETGVGQNPKECRRNYGHAQGSKKCGTDL